MMNEKDHTGTLSKLGMIFFILWIISLASNVLGSYEYKKEFLLIALVLWIIDAFIEALRQRNRPLGKRIARGLRKAGTVSMGLWIMLLILNALGWLEQWWSAYIIYALWIALVLMCTGFILNALQSRGHAWIVRSSLYSAGGIVLLFWLVLRYQSLYVSSQDTVLVAGIALIAGGFLIGASKKEYDYPFIDEIYAGIQEEMVEVPVFETSETVFVLSEETTIGNDASVTIPSGALFVDIFKDAQQIGTVYFGECSYSVRTSVHTETKSAIGMIYGHGTEWKEALYGQSTRRADAEDYSRYGLSEQDIKDLGVIYASNDPRAAEKFEDIIQRITESGKKVSLPFIKVFESAEGDFVKVGPIQVTDLKGKGSKIRIGKKTFVEPKDAVAVEEEPEGIAVRIKTPESNVEIVIDKDGVVVSGNEFGGTITQTAEMLEKGDVSYVNDGRKKSLESPQADILIKKDRTTLKTKELKVTVKGGLITASKAQRHVEMTNEQMAELFKTRIEAYFPSVVEGAFRGDETAASQLVASLADELDV
jgi:hypothetical protein